MQQVVVANEALVYQILLLQSAIHYQRCNAQLLGSTFQRHRGKVDTVVWGRHRCPRHILSHQTLPGLVSGISLICLHVDQESIV